MKITYTKSDIGKAKTDALLVFVDENWATKKTVEALDEHYGAALLSRIKAAGFDGKLHADFAIDPLGAPTGRIVLWGLGKASDLTPETLWDAAHKAAAKLLSPAIKNVAVLLDYDTFGEHGFLLGKLVQGLVCSQYRFDRYASEKAKQNKKNAWKSVSIHARGAGAPAPKAAKAEILRGEIIAEGVNVARDLINEPAESMTPAIFANAAKRAGQNAGFQVKVETEAAIKKKKMGLFLAVARGSKNPPRLITMTHKPKGASGKPIVLVGKGLMYDSGGYSLKPSASMETMKCDMSGSAAVVGAMIAIAKLKVKRPVIGIVAACENMIGGGAYRVGDIFTGMNGKTVEVMNTDAEGRLTLADALVYAQSFKPELIVDLATLTGACVVALGEQTVGVFADDAVSETIQAAFARAGEDAWRLPLNPRLKPLLKSDIADMKNVGGRWGGATTAALFLQEFVKDGQKWAHLDIAGPAFQTSAVGHMPKGGSGVGVSTLVELVAPTK